MTSMILIRTMYLFFIAKKLIMQNYLNTKLSKWLYTSLKTSNVREPQGIKDVFVRFVVLNGIISSVFAETDYIRHVFCNSVSFLAHVARGSLICSFFLATYALL